MTARSRLRSFLAGASLLLAPTSLACAGVAAAIPARPEKIEFKPLVFEPPAASDFRRTLSSGVPVYMAPSHEFPLLTITFSFKGGAYLEPAEKTGLAAMTGAMIRRGGTTTVSAQDMDEKFDFLAANAGAFIGGTSSGASLNCLKSNFDEAFALFMDMVRNPGFQEDKVKIYRDETIENMKQRNDDADSIASREWSALFWGRDHFEGRVPTRATIESISIEDMRAFHRSIFHPGNLIIGVTGDFEPADMMEVLEKALAGWELPPGGGTIPDPPAPTETPAPGIRYIEKDIPQGKVLIGHKGIRRDDPDAIPVEIMNDILGGGGFTSRIMSRVRSDEGLAYGAYSMFGNRVYYPGEFRAGFASKNSTVAQALKIVFEEMERIRTEPVSEVELETSTNQLIETFPRRFESKPAMVNLFIDDERTNRPADFWKTYRDRVRAVTAADVQRVAQTYLSPGNVAILVVGRWQEIYEGNVATAADPSKAASMRDFFDGVATELPLRDPLTQEPLSKE